MSNQQMLAVKIVQDRTISVGPTELPKCGPSDVLVKVRAVGVCATDLHVYQGLQNHRVLFPITPGHEWSGEVAVVGENVAGFAVGDRVVGEVTIPCGTCVQCRKGDYNICPKRVECGVFGKDGAAAQYISIPFFALHKFSPALSFDDACLIEPTAIVYRSIEKVKVSPSDRVLVIGAGPIGLLTVATAKVFGAASITLVDLRANRLQTGSRIGADHTIDISHEDLVNKSREVTDGAMFDVIIEASGSVNALESLFDLTALGARVCLVGIFDRKANIDANAIIRRDVQVYGSVGCPNVWHHVIPLVESGKIPVREIVTHYYTMDDFDTSLLQMENRDPSIIKAIVRPNGD